MLSKEDIVMGKKPLAVLEQIKESLDSLKEKLDVLIDVQKAGCRGTVPSDTPTMDVMTLLNMPDHLRKTAITICRNGRATAEQVAEQTNRARAVESSYLNQLVTMGYVKKQRKGRKAYFYVAME